ncbi:MAG: flavodoxin-dependent (E)-4-hydroxy-3-methylbut-2-enyl-diphosphate synthase, partial [Phycisphaerales bacterium]|nr:flavodoxin-dependent (E)-4-hydroxy-3-methylbut-2-enyl-diphosphate synthase [Phycisphaerales bacterium]
EAGAQLVRVATPAPADTAALAQIVAESPVGIVADVHFHFERALEAIAAGVVKIRLNPGNITDRDKVRRVIDAAGDAGVAIRIGVNEGSVSDVRDAAQLAADRERRLDELMAEKMADYLTEFDAAGFTNLVLSAKSHDAYTTVSANRLLAERWDYPLHLGVTHAGTATTGAIRSAAALGGLLAEGIGDTIRISFAGDPVAEVTAAKELLASLRLIPRDTVELIACPTCGRLQVDIQPVLDELEPRLGKLRVKRPVKLAIMGCVVNGPGEADQADIAICCGNDIALLYRNGERIKKITPDEIVPTILAELQEFLV